jgi:hypothetical protein
LNDRYERAVGKEPGKGGAAVRLQKSLSYSGLVCRGEFAACGGSTKHQAPSARETCVPDVSELMLEVSLMFGF